MSSVTKNINIEIPYDTWKKLKIMSIDKDKTLQEVVKDILVSHTNKKHKLLENIGE